MSRLKFARRAAQIGTLGFIIGVPFMIKSGYTAVVGSLYSIGIGPLWITEPLGGLQAALGTMRPDIPLLLSLLIPVALALLLGRVFCGWLCPQNTLSELFDYLGGKMRVRRIVRRPPVTAWPRYAILALVISGGIALGLPTASLLSAPGIISVQAGRFVLEGRVGVELSLIAGIVLVELIAIRRAWCNYTCPVGGFLGLLRTPRTLRVRMREDEASPCGGCGGCSAACGLGLDPTVGDIYPLCHNCGDCVEACRELSSKKPPLKFTMATSRQFLKAHKDGVRQDGTAPSPHGIVCLSLGTSDVRNI
jgi:ferredoxin-type protein NapH